MSMNFIKVTVPYLDGKTHIAHPKYKEYYINASCIECVSRMEGNKITYITMKGSRDDDDYYSVMETPRQIFKLISESEAT